MKHLKKFTSRKFLMSLAGFLGSASTAIQGFNTSDEKLQSLGIICMVISTAVYSIVEGVIDGKGVNKNVE